MASEGLFSASMASVLEDVFQQHQGSRLSDRDLASRKAEEAATRRYEAASWLRKTVGVVNARELPNEPSEEEFRIGLRNGLILCCALNKIYPSAISKVVESPVDSVVLPDGTALSAYQYFENIRNFLDAIADLGIPMFEASDLEKGGNSSRIVDCVLALKSYSEWKHSGGSGSWKCSGSLKPAKFFARKNLEPFANSTHDSSDMNKPCSLDIHDVLSDKKAEELPTLVEKAVEEMKRLLESQYELVKRAPKDVADGQKLSSKRKILGELTPTHSDPKMEAGDENLPQSNGVHLNGKINEEESKQKLIKRNLILDQQQKEIQELKHTLHATKSGMEFMQMKISEDFCSLGEHLKSLTYAASRYHNVIEENRKLYNQVQDLKGSIRVYCRVRPFLPGQTCNMSSVGHLDNDGNISILHPIKYGREGSKSFCFNKAFGPSATQAEVYSDMQPLVRSVLDGYNVCIFAYGQTGSGKTFTMSGPNEITNQSQGVNFRALSDLFDHAEQRRETFRYEISVQMIEIYNEQVRDLLSNDGLNKRLDIHNSSQKGLTVPDANLVPVASTTDVIELMNVGQRNRAVGATAMNDRSSRSHSCLTVHVHGRDLSTGTIFRGCMHLVDLAGSERVDKSEATGERLKEAQHINKSLSALGDVIAALAQKNSHVPYRNSKLTQLLQDSLGGQAKTLMFVHISPEVDAVGETISTLKFAERVATVELGAAKLNKEGSDVKELKEQIARLKEALVRKDGESEQAHSMPHSPLPSPVRSNRPRGGNGSQSSHRKPREDLGNKETRSNTSVKQSKTNFVGLQEPLVDTAVSPLWLGSDRKSEDKDNDYWDDKVLLNKQEVRELPQFFYQRCTPDLRVLPDQQCQISVKDFQEYETRGIQFESTSTDDSDVPEIATSDSSEADIMSQCSNHPPKDTNLGTGSGSKLKMPQPRPAKLLDIKTPIKSLAAPSPSRKLTASSMKKSVDRLNRSSNGKIASGK